MDLQTGERATNLALAISNYEDALTVLTEEETSFDWATAQHGLGVAFSHQADGTRSVAFQKSTNAFSLALVVRTKSKFPVEWAITQKELGNIYLWQSWIEDTNAIGQAVGYYTAALTVFRDNFYAVLWANTKNDLGIAYRLLRSGDHGQNLLKARQCFLDEISVRTAERFPDENRKANELLRRTEFELKMLNVTY